MTTTYCLLLTYYLLTTYLLLTYYLLTTYQVDDDELLYFASPFAALLAGLPRLVSLVSGE